MLWLTVWNYRRIYDDIYTRCRIIRVVITGFDSIVIILRKTAFDINYLASEWLRYLLVPNARFECVSCCVLGIPEFKSWPGYRLHHLGFFVFFFQSFQADVRVVPKIMSGPFVPFPLQFITGRS